MKEMTHAALAAHNNKRPFSTLYDSPFLENIFAKYSSLAGEMIEPKKAPTIIVKIESPHSSIYFFLQTLIPNANAHSKNEKVLLLKY